MKRLLTAMAVFKGVYGINPRNGDLNFLAQIQPVCTLSISSLTLRQKRFLVSKTPKMRLRLRLQPIGPRWELTALPQTPSWIRGEKGKGGKGNRKEGEGKNPQIESLARS